VLRVAGGYGGGCQQRELLLSSRRERACVGRVLEED
jgi:hypothetical protein